MQSDITYLKGVGPTRAKVLASDYDVHTIEDLLYLLPHKYIDCNIHQNIAALTTDILNHADLYQHNTDRYVIIRGTLLRIDEEKTRHGKKFLKGTFADRTGFVYITWFNSIRFIKKTLRCNTPYLLFGRPELYHHEVSFTHPELKQYTESDTQQFDSILPIYTVTERGRKCGLSSNMIGNLADSVLERVTTSTYPDPLPADIRLRHHLPHLADALHSLHHPTSQTVLDEALRRIKFDELFFLQLHLLLNNQAERQRLPGHIFKQVGEKFLHFYHHHLSFQLTGAQQRVIKEALTDCSSGFQMNRLLQGDVGSGKTIVALLLSLLAIDNGYQVCLMAPTEILARQHYNEIVEQLKPLNINVKCLTGKTTEKEKKEILNDTALGITDLLIGTHALIEDNVNFKNIGLAIIDEQHRFGVDQRARLWKKNIQPPHIFIMTATPIPRTLAMTLYSHLDISVLDELPPGRKPIVTRHLHLSQTNAIKASLRKQLKEGKQIYIVYPLILENEKIDLKAAEQGYEELCKDFPNCCIGLLHGKTPKKEKEEIFNLFKSGEMQILVATTVIEVGVNVPNASIMIIVNAERFGLSQLHQLRGRVGRGDKQSYCLLLTKQKLSATSQRRIQAMCDSNDGFRLAEEDLRLRGPGDIEGTRQSGIMLGLKHADLSTDFNILKEAREEAEGIITHDSTLQHPQYSELRKQLVIRFKKERNYALIS